MFNVIDRDLLVRYFEEAGWELRKSAYPPHRDIWFYKGDLITSYFRYYQAYSTAIHIGNLMEVVGEFPHTLNELRGVGLELAAKMIVDWAKEVEMKYKLTRL